GNRALKAPHFFTPLGEKSFVFHRAYITQPVCTPSRGSIVTGLWPHNHGCITNNIHLRDDCRSIAEYLPADYATAYYGKWHLGDENKAQHGFRDWRSIEDLYREYYKDPADLRQYSSYHNFLLARGFPPDQASENPAVPGAVFSRTMAAALPERYTKVSFLADEAVKFLGDRRDGQPFLLHVNCLEPHPPSYGPLNELHDPAAMPAGPAFARPLAADAAALPRRQDRKTRQDGYKNHPIATEQDWRRLRANYYGLVSMVDNAYARIMRALEESGQADNTIIVYTSDHGDMCGDHCLMQKGNFYEGSTHVPLAIHVPWLSRSRVDFNTPVSTVDLVPTLLDLMGVDVAGSVDGRSRAAALRRPAAWQPENITVEWNDTELAAVSGRSRVTSDGYKLNLYHDDQPELFDLNRDPGELTNLAAQPTHRDRVRRLTDEVRAWQQATRDTLVLRT
ncbi:MAG: sulfatase-like hydrolase/transferase, partial [Opitutaceae bacterium]|nr:sulfatase-like hydrolase/transferase [Opitutaceae bacterium]